MMYAVVVVVSGLSYQRDVEEIVLHDVSVTATLNDAQIFSRLQADVGVPKQ